MSVTVLAWTMLICKTDQNANDRVVVRIASVVRQLLDHLKHVKNKIVVNSPYMSLSAASCAIKHLKSPY